MRSSWPVRFLLPTVQVLAEGGWLAVVYAAVQAFSGTVPRVGPIELAIPCRAVLSYHRNVLDPRRLLPPFGRQPGGSHPAPHDAWSPGDHAQLGRPSA